ncbi:MAG TPA: VOC family protein [Abditibacterium sp.]|jgi:catechol 2,3-dioxygenase-like lactoylglutathione lyase family enzyme
MKIDHLNLVVADLERSAGFYERVFGFRRGFSAILQGDWIETLTGLPNVRAQCLFLELPGSAMRLELLRYDAPPSQPSEQNGVQVIGIRHLAFEVEDLDEILELLRIEGIAPRSAPVEVPFRVGNLGRKRLCYFQDPDGIILEIAAYEPL